MVWEPNREASSQELDFMLISPQEVLNMLYSLSQ